MKRRDFIFKSSVVLAGFIASSKLHAATIITKAADIGNEYKMRIIAIIHELKRESSNLVLKIMNGKKYIFDPYTHYPFDNGIKDEETGCQLFFHAHRENEYGHFHTFARDENNELIHLLLISMDKQGNPLALATVNRWVTGDKYVKADKLKSLSDNFFVNPDLYKDIRVVEFINNIFKAYRDEIFQLFDERDKWINNYVNNYFREPFEDRDFEILSQKTISL